jgi:hypothetical protein
MRRIRRATGRSAASRITETTMNTIQLAAAPAPIAATSAANSAPPANGARKKLVVAISPSPNTTAAISQSTQSSISRARLAPRLPPQ